MEAAGGQDAYMELIGRLTGAITASTITTYMNIPALSHQPSGY